jgi:hypothetical protein
MKFRLLVALLLVAFALAGCDAGRSDEPARLTIDTPELGAELAIGQPFRVVARISDDEPISPSRVSLLQFNGDVIASVTVENPSAADVLVIDTVLFVPEGTEPLGNPEGSAFLDFTYGSGGSTALQVFLVDAP